jgi:hypothetical protein
VWVGCSGTRSITNFMKTLQYFRRLEHCCTATPSILLMMIPSFMEIRGLIKHYYAGYFLES